jgi:hypothetical protein
LANLRTTADIVDAVLKRCGELTDGTSNYDTGGDVLGYVNSVYRGVLAGENEFGIDVGEPWVWAQASQPQLIELKPPFETGTVTLVNGSTSATLSVAPSYSVSGWYFRAEGDPEWYTISAHTASTTALTLDQTYLGDSDTLEFTIVKLDYLLPTAVCRLIAPIRVYKDNNTVMGFPEQGKVYELDTISFDRKWPRMLLGEGVPENYCVIARDTTDNVTVRFSNYVPTSTRAEVPYIGVQADLTDSSLSIPVIPFGFREILVHGASYFLMLDKSDNRADAEAALCKAKLQALVNNNRKQLSLAGSNYGKLVPRRGNTRRRFGANIDQ